MDASAARTSSVVERYVPLNVVDPRTGLELATARYGAYGWQVVRGTHVIYVESRDDACALLDVIRGGLQT